MTSLTVALICGGQSVEHEVSILSAKSVLKTLLTSQYRVQLFYITHMGAWFWIENHDLFIRSDRPALEEAVPMALDVSRPGAPWITRDGAHQFAIDVVFPLVHGSYGEDGYLQGLLEMLNVPYVGCDVLSSALCMDKAMTRQLLYPLDIPMSGWIVVKREDDWAALQERAEQAFGYPLFIKPSKSGSSVGISKVKQAEEFEPALALAFRHDNEVLIEQGVQGKEIECSVLGSEHPRVSVPAELMVHHDFYSYQAKYLDPHGMTPKIPADLPPHVIQKVQQLVLKVYEALHCSGMARVDCFVTENEEVLLNEVNTIPGFTSISLYPKMWEASGIPYAALIDQLIQLGLERFNQKKSLSTQYIAE
ncbi:MAG TPA: D-alanine--D-alanine ligase family protein [Coxiellaceae bacterium]|nr:D-alanine--D-alanine ligase family protein [Coxiellaceae bacterium]